MAKQMKENYCFSVEVARAINTGNDYVDIRIQADNDTVEAISGWFTKSGDVLRSLLGVMATPEFVSGLKKGFDFGVNLHPGPAKPVSHKGRGSKKPEPAPVFTHFDRETWDKYVKEVGVENISVEGYQKWCKDHPKDVSQASKVRSRKPKKQPKAPSPDKK